MPVYDPKKPLVPIQRAPKLVTTDQNKFKMKTFMLLIGSSTTQEFVKPYEAFEHNDLAISEPCQKQLSEKQSALSHRSFELNNQSTILNHQYMDDNVDPYRDVTVDIYSYLSRPKFNNGIIEVMPTKIYIDRTVTK